MMFIQLLLLLILGSSTLWAADEISITSSQTATLYSEATDSQSIILSGPGSILSYRGLETLGFLDLGLEWGTYSVEGSTKLHEVQLSTDFVSLLTGLNFRFSPKWLEYKLDVGYRLSVDRMELYRTESDGKVNYHKIGQLNQQPFYRLGIRVFLGNALFFGLSREQQSNLFQKGVEDLKPTVQTAASTLLTLGYRFGGQSYWRAPIRSGKSRSWDPCLLHRICDPS